MANFRLLSLSRFLPLLVVVCTSVSLEEEEFEWPLYMPTAGSTTLKVSPSRLLQCMYNGFVHTQLVHSSFFTYPSTTTIDAERPNYLQTTTISVSLQV